VLLKEKHSFKNENDINKMYEAIINGNVDDWIWRKIIEKMYDPKDFEILEAKLLGIIEDKRRNKVLYS
jgi:hypothetical protein